MDTLICQGSIYCLRTDVSVGEICEQIWEFHVIQFFYHRRDLENIRLIFFQLFIVVCDTSKEYRRSDEKSDVSQLIFVASYRQSWFTFSIPGECVTWSPFR